MEIHAFCAWIVPLKVSCSTAMVTTTETHRDLIAVSRFVDTLGVSLPLKCRPVLEMPPTIPALLYSLFVLHGKV